MDFYQPKPEMEEIKDHAKKILQNSPETICIERLVQKWCDKVNTLPADKLKKLTLYHKINTPVTEIVKLAQRLSNLKTKYDFRISELVFRVNYKADFGQGLVIVGSPQILGKWSSNNGFKMTWTEGHNWAGKCKTDQLGTEFDYKYSIQDMASRGIKKWENCGNRKFSIQDIELFLDRAEIAAYVTESEEYLFEYKGVRMKYEKNKEVLTMYDNWQS